MPATIAAPPLTARPLRCRGCGTERAAAPTAICEECVGPLAPAYAPGRPLAAREIVAGRAPSLWRYTEWLPRDGEAVWPPDTGSTPLVDAPALARRFDQRRDTGVERPHRIAVERQPLLVAPERGRPAGDDLAVGQRAARLVHGVEGPETLLADRGRGGGALGPAAAAAERPGGERWRSDGSRHLEPQQKNPGNNCRGRSLFSTLFNVAAIRGKAPRVVDCRLAA